MAKFESSGAQVIGISVDPPEKNKVFASVLGLTFPLLSDTDRTVSRAYGVLIPVLRLAHRVTFGIDQRGTVRFIQRGKQALDPRNAAVNFSVAIGS